jgi:hypothetical protein
LPVGLDAIRGDVMDQHRAVRKWRPRANERRVSLNFAQALNTGTSAVGDGAIAGRLIGPRPQHGADPAGPPAAQGPG